MKLRDLLLVLVALLLLSVVVGIAVLYRLYLWNAQPSMTNHTPTLQETAKRPMSRVALATLTPLPLLVTPTPSPSPSATMTPSQTPSPTPTATATATFTPTPLPVARLADAHQAKRNGDYAIAQLELQSVLQAPDAAWEATEAGYQIGIISYLDGEYETAKEMLGQFIEQHPQDHRAGAAHFYLAETLTHTGEYAAAIEHYTLYVKQQDVLADLIYTSIAENHMTLGSYLAAADAYEVALERAPDLGQQYDLREQIGLAYSAQGHYDEAIVWLQEITEYSQNVYRLARIWYRIGETYRLAGQEDHALQAFARAVSGDPRPGYAHTALVELVNAGVPVDEYQRGLIDYHAGSYDAAIAALGRHLETTSGRDIDAAYYLALSHLEAGSLELAIQVCDRTLADSSLIDTPDGSISDPTGRWGEIWLLKGQAFARYGREGEAIETYLEFVKADPNHPLAPEAYWRAAQQLEQTGRFQQAADVYTTLADTYKDTDRAPMARFRAGIARYRIGDVDAAIATWQDLTDAHPAAKESLGARYWLGKTLWGQGQIEKAQAILQALADKHPRNYYGLRAAHFVQNKGRIKHWHTASTGPGPNNLHLTNDEQAEKDETARWLRSWTDSPEEGDPSAVSADLAGHLLFRRAMEMNTLNLRSQARDTFEQLRQEISGDALSLYQLAMATRDLELYAPSLRAAIDLIVLAPEPSVLDMPRLIQRLAFPTYFSELILAESATQTIDPLLMFALIRQESVFDAEATSWAGAIGLTQIMPSTGEWIAEMTAWPEYSHESLQRAYLNVKFGAWFLARILDQAEGNVMAALAGYNGGPARAQDWQEQSGGDPDLFVEVITRDEPQRYVQLIYRHYDAYVRLYGD